jgi:predicted GNAT superfamily acetyltransferase
MKRPGIEIRPLQAIEEYRQAEQVQRSAWHMTRDLEITPLHLLVTMQKNGGLVLGAFDGTELVGFLCGFVGRTPDGHLKHCSHQMGTLPAYQSSGVGQRLKWCQREMVLQQGLKWVTWTYDPLETVNGFLNIVKLGGVCRTYLRNVYGELQDTLNRGLPTDRFQVDWWLDSPRVAAAHSGALPAPSSLAEAMAMGAEPGNVVSFRNELPEPQDWSRTEAPVVLVEVPAHFQRLKGRAPETAATWRAITREIFENYFQCGYTVTNLLRHQTDELDRCFYVLQSDLALPHARSE